MGNIENNMKIVKNNFYFISHSVNVEKNALNVGSVLYFIYV